MNQPTYPRDTIGYHHVRSQALFGADSPATEWLEKRAAESPGGMDEPVVMHESQVLHLLARLHFGDELAANKEQKHG
ncbi:MAG: hypothetical protein GY838_13050 [bacterium]|nr:hypothetical protein [bacterium]